MVYCHTCQTDHPSDTFVCPDCRQTLLEKIDATKPVAVAPDDSWVTVAKIKGTRLAEKAQNGLNANNIPSMIMPKTFGNVFNTPAGYNITSELSGYYQEKLLLVPRGFQNEAKLIVKNVLKKENTK